MGGYPYAILASERPDTLTISAVSLAWMGNTF